MRDIEYYKRFLSADVDWSQAEHWTRAKKLTFTLFNVLIDQDLTELVWVLKNFPSYIPLVCEHFRYSYSYAEISADIEATSELFKISEGYHTKQFARNVVVKLPKIRDLDDLKAILDKIEGLQYDLHPIVLAYYKVVCKDFIAKNQVHTLQKIYIEKRIGKIEVELDFDIAAKDRDKELNIPYME